MEKGGRVDLINGFQCPEFSGPAGFICWVNTRQASWHISRCLPSSADRATGQRRHVMRLINSLQAPWERGRE